MIHSKDISKNFYEMFNYAINEEVKLTCKSNEFGWEEEERRDCDLEISLDYNTVRGNGWKDQENNIYLSINKFFMSENKIYFCFTSEEADSVEESIKIPKNFEKAKRLLIKKFAL